jgi:hypothetical protein
VKSTKPNSAGPGWAGGPETQQMGTRTLLIAGAIAVVGGLLFPLSAHILDVLLIFSVSLTAAALVTTFSARGALQVQGFPLLIVLATMLRMALSLSCSKLILVQGDAGTIISLFGTIFVRNNPVLAILVFGTLAAIIFGIIYKTVKAISRTGTEFTADIVPIKQISIDSDLNAGVINKSQALSLREKIARERGFFVAMAGAARFILCCAVIELVIVIVNMVGSMTMGVAGGTTTAIPIKTYATLAVGAGMMTQISALVVAAASVYLVRKSSVSAAVNVGAVEQGFTKRIKVVAKAPGESAEITNPAANPDIKDEKKVITEDLEWFDESAEGENEKDDFDLWVWEEIKDSDYHEAIAALIESKSTDEARMILIAAERVEELPVTIPVNIAMRLAKRGRKCLLVDLDSQRDAISKVFELDSAEHGDEAQRKAAATARPTCISNLWVWSANNSGKGDCDGDMTNIKDALASLESRYDRLVIYAPNLKVRADSNTIASCAQAAMLFGSKGEFEGSSISDFRKLLNSHGCTIFEPSNGFAEGL